MLAITEYTVADLKTMAAEKNIKGRSAMNKADLYAALSALEAAAEQDSQKVTKSVQEYYGFGGVDTETFIEPIGPWSSGVYVPPTYREALEELGWKRAPRKLKKFWRSMGIIAHAA